jgi:hypothetical protein
MKDIEREQLFIRQYLLGELDEDDREQLEQRVITDADYKEKVLIKEEDLLEDFVNGSLSPRELELFTRKYSSSPDQWRKVKIARALRDYAANHPVVAQPMVMHKTWGKSIMEFFQARSRFGKLSLAALGLLLIAGGSLFLFWLLQQKGSDFDVLLRLNKANSEILKPDSSVAAVSLPALLLRGKASEPRTITINQQIKTVQLQIQDPSGGTHLFRATLKDATNREVFTLDELRGRQLSQQSLLVLQIPVQMLVPQDYQLEISEKEPGGVYSTPITYYLHVQKVG